MHRCIHDPHVAQTRSEAFDTIDIGQLESTSPKAILRGRKPLIQYKFHIDVPNYRCGVQLLTFIQKEGLKSHSKPITMQWTIIIDHILNHSERGRMKERDNKNVPWLDDLTYCFDDRLKSWDGMLAMALNEDHYQSFSSKNYELPRLGGPYLKLVSAAGMFPLCCLDLYLTSILLP